jgi:hypothetical protein
VYSLLPSDSVIERITMSEATGFGISYIAASGNELAYSGGCDNLDTARAEAQTGLLNIYPQAAYANIYRGSMRPEGQPLERVNR